jgi:hypothetical protein
MTTMNNKDWLSLGEVEAVARERCSLSRRKVLELLQARKPNGDYELKRQVFPGCVHRRYCRISLYSLLQISDK